MDGIITSSESIVFTNQGRVGGWVGHEADLRGFPVVGSKYGSIAVGRDRSRLRDRSIGPLVRPH